MSEIENQLDLSKMDLKLPPVPAESISLEFQDEILEITEVPYPECPLPFANSSLQHLPIINARFLSQGEDVKTVIEISFDNQEAKLSFQPGDTIGILPQNDKEDIDYLINRLKLDDVAKKSYTLGLKDNGVSKKKVVLPSHLPKIGTLEYVLMKCIDVHSILKKILICALSKHTTDKDERRELEEISSMQGSQLYMEKIFNKKLCIIDLLKQYHSCDPPVTLLLQQLPRLLPRPYSICNSPLKGKDVIKICFSVESNENRKGVTTGWLEKLTNDFLKTKTCTADYDIKSLSNGISNLNINEPGKRINVQLYARKSTTFCLPDDCKIPVIMIGPGTGVAPFIGFLEERKEQKIMKPQEDYGKMYLYFGCRFSEKDFIYKDELNSFLENETLNKLGVTHSRENNDGLKYVQDRIKIYKEEIVQLICEESAKIYVCGDLTVMAKDVAKCLQNCIAEVKNISTEEADTILNSLKSNNQYIQDIWT